MNTKKTSEISLRTRIFQFLLKINVKEKTAVYYVDSSWSMDSSDLNDYEPENNTVLDKY